MFENLLPLSVCCAVWHLQRPFFPCAAVSVSGQKEKDFFLDESPYSFSGLTKGLVVV